VTVTLKGINDAPTVTAHAANDPTVSASIAENAGVSGDTSLHVVSNSFSFADADLSDTHTVRVTAKGSGYLGTFTPTVSSDTTGGQSGAVSWNFQVADKALDGLAAGQSVTQIYTVSISDGKSGTVTQDVSITLTGASDQFVFQSLLSKTLPTFTSGDTLAFNGSVFGGQHVGAVDASYFTDGTAATVSGHGQFLNDTAHKQLLWDADGIGGKAPVAIATFTTPQTLHLPDLVIV
jgi:VCBS repeat-containing protein